MSAPTIASVIDATCQLSGLSRADLLSGQRSQRYSRARQAAVYVARLHTGKSFSIIGCHMGGRTETAILKAHQMAEKRMQADEEFRLFVDALIKTQKEKSDD